jgi:uncharacterized protein (TIGR03663 family)
LKQHRVWGARVLFGAALLAAAALRFAHLDNRPMHADEAVHAIKFGLLLEQGYYRYDPHEFHGPTLNYATLPVAWLCGSFSLRQTSESQLRAVPAVFGLLLVLMPLALGKQLGEVACLAAAVLTALSPAMVFYSRYYIQEMLLVTLSFAAIVALCRFAEKSHRLSPEAEARSAARTGPMPPCPWAELFRFRAIAWLAVLGVLLGLMHATKETCLIAAVSMGVAALATMPQLRKLGRLRLIVIAAGVLIVAAGVSALLISGFGQNPRGVVDSYVTYLTYLGRAGGAGSEGPHVYPFYQYLHWLFAWRGPDGTLCSEALIAVLAVVGLAAAVFRFGLSPAQVAAARFFAIYSLVMTAAYAAIPYKTPWCALGFLHGLIILAGLGTAALLGGLGNKLIRCAVVGALVAAAVQLGCQAYRASFLHPAHPDNPCVYAHTSPQLLELVAEVHRIAERASLGSELYAQVICAQDDYWPLPWYLRPYRNIGWYSGPPDAPPALLVITQPKLEDEVAEYLYTWPKPGERFQYLPVGPAGPEPQQWELRPNVFLLMYLRRDIWELCQ